MLTAAIRFVAAKGAKGNAGYIQLLCHVKPGVDARREGVVAVTDEHIEVCVAAQAREGEANKAVREVIAEALHVSKSDVEIMKGLKSRVKTVAVANTRAHVTPEQEIERIKNVLQDSAVR
ncbi:YggU-like protein [Lophiostoma macrostomum CBS 122681]|uniref:YggU-like protein n=1 Tax=Lophiostoma macrostomum CBS 122681 TaxID=1314788 RepID=A0A6A6STQ2_9PLEO|nr:YggU-like protein [Lophiostoma macrostomum CBS 122681]